MLPPAIFHALAAIDAWCVGAQPGRVLLARDQVGLAGQQRHPERVDDVGRAQHEADRAADGDVDLVRRLEDRRAVLVLVGDLPPPLVRGDVDRRGGRFVRRLDGGHGADGPGREEGEHGHGHGDAAIDPGHRLLVARAANGVAVRAHVVDAPRAQRDADDDERRHDDDDGCRQPDRAPEDFGDLVARRAEGAEIIHRRIAWRGIGRGVRCLRRDQREDRGDAALAARAGEARTGAARTGAARHASPVERLFPVARTPQVRPPPSPTPARRLKVLAHRCEGPPLEPGAGPRAPRPICRLERRGSPDGQTFRCAD